MQNPRHFDIWCFVSRDYLSRGVGTSVPCKDTERGVLGNDTMLME